MNCERCSELAHEQVREVLDPLLAACKEARDEIVYWLEEYLTDDARAHPRGSGPARVYDALTIAIARAEEGR